MITQTDRPRTLYVQTPDGKIHTRKSKRGFNYTVAIADPQWRVVSWHADFDLAASAQETLRGKHPDADIDVMDVETERPDPPTRTSATLPYAAQLTRIETLLTELVAAIKESHR